MPYLSVTDFKYGMDRRRKQSVGIPGTLWILKNAVVSRGGDIERTKKFVKTHDLPVNAGAPFNATQGLAVRDNQLVVFRWPDFENAELFDVEIVPLANPDDSDADHVLTDTIAKTFDGKVYAIATYANGDVFHFYNGERVTDWETDVSPGAVSVNSIARRFAVLMNEDEAVDVVARDNKIILKSVTAGTPFTASATIGATTAETRAIGTITLTGFSGAVVDRKITAVTANAVALIGTADISWNGSLAGTASALAGAINAKTSVHGYRATASGTVVTIKAPVGLGATANGYVLTCSTANISKSIADFAGGVTATGAGSINAHTVQNNVAAVAEVVSTGEVEILSGANGGVISSVQVNAVELLSAPVEWLSNVDETANALTVAINDNMGTTGIQASALAGVVTLSAAAGTGSAPNGHLVAVEAIGISVSTSNFAGGVDAVAAKKQRMYFSIDDLKLSDPATWPQFVITLNGVEYSVSTMSAGMGTSIFVQKSRVWSTVSSLIQYCKLNTPSDWTDADTSSGAGFINIANQVDGAQALYGMEEYNGKAAIFAESAVVIYALASDAQNITIAQTLKNTGTIAPSAIMAYGADDVFYLDKTGIRSLKSRDGYSEAFASDIGSAIDPFIKEIVGALPTRIVQRAQSAIEPGDGRFMMAIGQYIIVLSYFPASKITAWSYIDFGQQIDRLVRCGDRIYIRSGNAIYAYGGEDGDQYPDDDEFPAIVETSFMDGKDPATMKWLKSYDHAAEGEWFVELLPDPNDTAKSIAVGRLTDSTFNDPSAWLPGYTSKFALRFTCDRAGFASLSAIAQHFEKAEKQ